jgi:hypothetical protein
MWAEPTIKVRIPSGVGIIMREIPKDYVLSQNYPNPFNPSTIIEYELPLASYVSLKVFNVLGLEVATPVNEVKPAGRFTSHLDASSMPSGVYFYRLQAGDFVVTKRLVVLK